RIHPEDLSRVNLTVQRYLSGRTGEYYCEHRVRCKNGTYLWILDRGKVIERTPDGAPKRMIGTHTDISKAKLTEQNLMNSEAVFRSLFEQASIGLAKIDPDFRFERVNHRFVEIMKFRSSELAGQDVSLVFGDEINSIKESLANDVSGSIAGHHSAEFICKTKDTSKIWVNITINPVRDADSRIDYYILIIDDISHKKRAEAVIQKSREELEYANKMLEDASRMKDNFLASMSHELRTPLTSIIGLTEALQQGVYGDMEPQQLDPLKHISQSSEHLLALINDILDVSKAAAGQMGIEKEIISLMQVCRSAIQIISPLAAAKNITINFSMILVTGDVNNNRVIISIEDSGIGIAKEHLVRAFEPFVQIDSALSRQIAGTGLGLAIVKSFTELHGGSVRIDSAPGRGTLVEIELPWQYGQSPQTGNTVNGESERPNILVVEDSPEDRHTMSYLLRKLGYNTYFSNYLGDTISVAEKITPRVILVDINLPGESGWEILSSLKSSDQFRGIPVVVCSAADEVIDAVVNGAEGYLRKPYSFSELSRELERLTSVSEVITPHVRSRRLILLAEDNKTNAGTFRDFLVSREYEVLLAYDGVEAVKMAGEHHPDIILMDVQMPVLDGLSATSQLRNSADEYLRDIPVIALTAMVMPGDQEKCFEAGANDYLAKPVSLIKLESKIKKFLN
ncbi:MAG: response regulator, partial [Chlorobiota bacterium]